MRFKYDKLRGKIKEMFGTQEKFASALGMGRIAINKRLNNTVDFSPKEMVRACFLLGIDIAEISVYFFCLESSERRTIREDEKKSA